MVDIELGQQAPPAGGYSIARFEALIAHMDGRLREMLRDRDPDAVFQLTYLTFSRQVLKAVQARRFEDPAWAIDMCCRFVEVYLRQVELWHARAPGQCRPWRMAFEATEEGRAGALQAMLLGMNAHIHYDLAFVTLGACRAAGDLDGLDAGDRALSTSRSGVPTVRYRDFLVINRVGWESIPLLQDVVLGQFNRLLYWGNKLAGNLTRLVGQRVFIESRDASWCQTALLVHARDAAERALVTRLIDGFAASIADVIGATTLRPDLFLEHAGSWSRRWERLDPTLVAGLVDLAARNPVVSELALRELAFAGADPVSVLETLLQRDEARLAAIFARQALRLAPRRRRQRLERYLEEGRGGALEVLEALALADELPPRLPRRAPVRRVVARWDAERAQLERLARWPESLAHVGLAGALRARRQLLDERISALGLAPDPGRLPEPSADEGRRLLLGHADRWIQLCAAEALAGPSDQKPTAIQGDAMTSVIERVLFLKETALFVEVDPSVLVHVAERLEPRRLSAGERLVREGAKNDGIHVIRSGQVEVSQQRGDERVRIAHLGARDSVGELSVLNDTPATADCIALTEVDSFFVPRSLLGRLLHQHPRLALGMIRMLSQRLMATTQRVEHHLPKAS